MKINKALQNTKSSQTMENATPSGLYKKQFNNKKINPFYKALVNRVYNAIKAEFLKRTGFRLTQQNVWALALLRMYFYTSSKTPVLHPSYRQMSHKEIIKQLPHTPIGKAIKEGAFNADGSLSSTYKRIVRINTYRPKTVGIKKADVPKKAAGVIFEVFQPDQRTPEEKASGAIVHSANIIRLTGWAKEVADQVLGDPKLSAWFWGPGETADDEASKKRDRKRRKRKSRHGEEPEWVEAAYRQQTDPDLPDPEPDEELPWPPEVKEAHQRQIERQIAEGIEARRRSALEQIEAYRRGVAQGGAVEKPGENRGIEEKTRTICGPLPPVGILDPLQTYLRPPYPPCAVDNSPPPNNLDFKTASKGDVVETIDNIEIAKPSSLQTTADSTIQIQKSESHTNLPIPQTINNHKLPTKFPGDGNKQQSIIPKPRLSPAEELAALVAFVATYGSGSGRWIETLKQQLGPNPPPPSPDVPFYPPHLQVSGGPRPVPKHTPFQPRGHPEDHRFGYSPAHRQKGKDDGLP